MFDLEANVEFRSKTGCEGTCSFRNTTSSHLTDKEDNSGYYCNEVRETNAFKENK